MLPHRKWNKSKYIAREPKSIARICRFLRRIIGIDTRLAPDILEVFDLLKRIFPRLKLQIVPDFMLPEAEARAYPQIWTIKIRSGIFEGLLRGDVRARWTLAHELGHIALQHPRRPYRKRVGKEVRGIDKLFEKEANIFATEFLAPIHIAQKYKAVDRIKDVFQISTEAAQYRFYELERFGGEAESLEPVSLEDQLFIVYTSMRTTISGINFSIEPIKGDLLYASILVVVAARLLLDAYESVRKTRGRKNYKIAAALCAAILYITPIRSAILVTCNAKDILRVNQQFAMSTVSAILGINQELIDNEMMQRLFRASMDLFQAGYLAPLVSSDNIFDREFRGIPNLESTPTFDKYTENHDISWDEIKALENLMNIFQPLEASCRPH